MNRPGQNVFQLHLEFTNWGIDCICDGLNMFRVALRSVTRMALPLMRLLVQVEDAEGLSWLKAHQNTTGAPPATTYTTTAMMTTMAQTHCKHT